MLTEDLEFQISQYVDGTLSAQQMKSVDDLVNSSPQAMRVLDEHRRLNRQLVGLRSSAAGLPTVQWNQLAQKISDGIDQSDRPAVAGRIGFYRAQLRPMRIAAAVLISATALVATRFAFRRSPIAPIDSLPAVVDVVGPQADVASASPVVDVTVGPSPALAASDSRYGEGVIGQGPAKVIIVGMVSKVPGQYRLH